MDKILITGGAGFIGSTLAKKLAKNNDIYIIDDLSMGKLENLDLQLNNNIKFIQGSVTDTNLMTDLLSENTFDFIYHLAAIASVADSVERPIETHQVNFESVLLLLELCKKYQNTLKRLVFTSSAAVYGDEPTLPKHEESVIRPLTPYAIDKFAAEQYVLDYNHLYGLPATAVRFFNVYGPNQNPNSPYSGVISIMIDSYKKQLAGENNLFTIFGDGKQSRDFVYVEDVVNALLLVATNNDALGKQFNVGTGIETTLLDLLEVLDNEFRHQLSFKFEDSRSGDIKDSLANIGRLSKLGYHPAFNINEGLKKYVANLK
ncbi:NAD-dependent epimerase/dehydratase family protein [Enterococcus dispar]|uniref:NAD-dependent epimerase/dehydratase family protein n=1 Tax=Enterococcus dispar TaxID=44009 RepID=UPI00232D45C7|nr:NAD-dependent epimerase/dehydratase family protein [Enterococcus dispar]WCG34061.1 NAD-dependent epimerase/dehydratase family protein [Enterococcus dispar]